MSRPELSYRRGDIYTPLGQLRLTVGGLAEITDRLAAPSAAKLAERLRQLNPNDARILLTALLRPVGKALSVDALEDDVVAQCVPSIADCITCALGKPQ